MVGIVGTMSDLVWNVRRDINCLARRLSARITEETEVEAMPFMDNMNTVIYIVEEYVAYDGSWIIYTSQDYDKAKQVFDNKVEQLEESHGVVLSEIPLDKEMNLLNRNNFEKHHICKDNEKLVDWVAKMKEREGGGN